MQHIPGAPLGVTAGALLGVKAVCSGAGAIHRAVITAEDAAGHSRLVYLPIAPAQVTRANDSFQGMCAAVTGRVTFAQTPIAPADWFGAPGDYLREPDFSAGAWRTCAVTCGGLEALVEAAMQQLVARGRHTHPHQRARLGRAWLAKESALMWLTRAADAAEERERFAEPKEITATVNFARIAIETACLDALTLVERSLGLSAFRQSNPIERIRRDLATYLRQPAPDEALDEATAYIFQTRMQAA
jgi:hypothetical protein